MNINRVVFSTLLFSLSLLFGCIASAQSAPVSAGFDWTIGESQRPCARCDGPGDPHPPSPPTSKVDLFDVNPPTGTITVRMNDNTWMIIDGNSDQVELIHPAGTWNFPLATVLNEMAGGNSGIATGMWQTLHDALDTPEAVGGLYRNDGLGRPIHDEDVLPGDGLNLIVAPPGHGAYGTCAYQSCLYKYDWFGSWGWYSVYFVPRYGSMMYEAYSGLVPPPPWVPQPDPSDPAYQNWRRWRDDHCDALATDKARIGVAGGAALVACGALTVSTGGLAALLCVSSLGELGLNMIDHNRDAAICESTWWGY